MMWENDLEYEPVLELGETRVESFARASQAEEIIEMLPGLDCGSCGAPTCRCLAEDIVRGAGKLTDCIVLLRQQVNAHDLHKLDHRPNHILDS